MTFLRYVHFAGARWRDQLLCDSSARFFVLFCFEPFRESIGIVFPKPTRSVAPGRAENPQEAQRAAEVSLIVSLCLYSGNHRAMRFCRHSAFVLRARWRARGLQGKRSKGRTLGRLESLWATFARNQCIWLLARVLNSSRKKQTFKHKHYEIRMFQICL